jgi:hypothetical protein
MAVGSVACRRCGLPGPRRITGEVARVRRLGTPHIIAFRTCPVDDHLNPPPPIETSGEEIQPGGKPRRVTSGFRPPIGRVAARDYAVLDMGRTVARAGHRRLGYKASVLCGSP